MCMQVMNIGTKRQLFIDERHFADSYGVKIKLNQPVSRKLVDFPLNEWDGYGIHAYLDVIKTPDNKFMMYYGSQGRDAPKGHKELRKCLALSDDGINWHKPKLDIFCKEKYPGNNIVAPGAYGSVIYDYSDKKYPFKSLCNIIPNNDWNKAVDTLHGDEFGEKKVRYLVSYLLYSEDGIHWDRAEKFASPFFHDSHNQLLFDRRLNKYVAYVRWLADNRPRTVARYEINELFDLPWKHRQNKKAQVGPQGALERMGDELDTVLITDPSGPDANEVDIYCPGVCQYPDVDDNYYLSFMPVYRHYPFENTMDTMLEGKNHLGHFANDGPLDIRVATSHDGIFWQRHNRKAYMRLGLNGSWDAGRIYPAPGLIVNGDEIWQYYVGFEQTHGKESIDGKIGLAIQHRDRFLGANADYCGGSFTTPLITFKGSKLILNIDCSALGFAKVEFRDCNNRPMPGLTLEDCREIDLNSLEHEAIFKSGATLPEGLPVRMHFQMRDCILYSYEFKQN